MSDKVKKINEYDWGQHRQVVVTQFRVLVVQTKKLKREFEYKDILGVSISCTNDPKKQMEETLLPEFLIHVKDEHDFRAQSTCQRQVQLLEAIRYFYEKT